MSLHRMNSPGHRWVVALILSASAWSCVSDPDGTFEIAAIRVPIERVTTDSACPEALGAISCRQLDTPGTICDEVEALCCYRTNTNDAVCVAEALPIDAVEVAKSPPVETSTTFRAPDTTDPLEIQSCRPGPTICRLVCTPPTHIDDIYRCQFVCYTPCT